MNLVMDDAQLSACVRRAQAGDRRALEDVLAHLRPRIFRYCLARLGRREVAEDVTQDTCLAFVEALPSYDDRGNLITAFAFGIAWNKVLMARRGSARRRVSPVDAVPDRPSEDAGPAELAARGDSWRRLLRQLDPLSDRDRDILLLRVVAGLSAREVGVVLVMTDPARIAADDALLDQLAARDPAAARAEPAAGVLAHLATSLDREPVPSDRARGPAHRRRVLAVAAAAAALLACVGTAIAAVPARPGSPLYGVHSLLYGPVQPSASEQAKAKLAAARHDLDIAAAAAQPWQDPHLAAARADLAAIPALIGGVSDTTTARSLNQQLATLQARASQLDQPDGANGQSGTNQRPGIDRSETPTSTSGPDQTGNQNQNGQSTTGD